MTAPFNKAILAASHNSCMGVNGGNRRSLLDQLNDGCRVIELDFHRDQQVFFKHKDYGVGHHAIGDEVLTGGGNPDHVLLRAWLDVLAQWRSERRDALPLTLVLDNKSDISQPFGTSFFEDDLTQVHGDLAHMNELLLAVFGRDVLFTAEDLAAWRRSQAPERTYEACVEENAWPSVDSLRGKVIVVLSGNRRPRERYRHTEGLEPAVAVNASGAVVAVYHAHEAGKVWYWTGQMNGLGEAATSGERVEWQQHHPYDKGVTPAVAINDSGWVVEVHRSQRNSGLWYHVGKINLETRMVDWSSHSHYDSGSYPAVALSNDNVVVEAHEGEGGGQVLWYRVGKLDDVSGTIVWNTMMDDARQYATGLRPSVRFSPSGQTVVLTHVANVRDDKAQFLEGTVAISGPRGHIDWIAPSSDAYASVVGTTPPFYTCHASFKSTLVGRPGLAPSFRSLAAVASGEFVRVWSDVTPYSSSTLFFEVGKAAEKDDAPAKAEDDAAAVTEDAEDAEEDDAAEASVGDGDSLVEDIPLDSPKPTEKAKKDEAEATAADAVPAMTAADPVGGIAKATLLPKAAVRYPQVMFVEAHATDAKIVPDAEIAFMAAPFTPKPAPFPSDAKARGKIVRLWSMIEPHTDLDKLPKITINYAATDFPHAPRYAEYLARVGAVMDKAAEEPVAAIKPEPVAEQKPEPVAAEEAKEEEKEDAAAEAAAEEEVKEEEDAEAIVGDE